MKKIVSLIVVIVGCIGVQIYSNAQNIKSYDTYERDSMPVVPYPLSEQQHNVTFDWNKAKARYAARNEDYVGYYLAPEAGKLNLWDEFMDKNWRWATPVVLILILVIVNFILIYMSYLNNKYVEPCRKRTQKQITKYRKYLMDCDKRGKTPLTYKQWKFAYVDKKA
ncbi:MAG: hypothetical protein J5620_03510 [Alphaproteobacteria bacterium]|nr:hypothetical protein [Alphaproteobacteria bacterium]